MNLRLSVPLLLFLGVVALARADSIDDAEAAKRGVSVQVIILERRVADLERENKELRERIVALQKQVASKPVVESPASTIPAEVKPVAKAEPQWNRDYSVLKDMLFNKMAESEASAGDNESAAQRQIRTARFEQWINSTFVGKPVEWSGEIKDIKITYEGSVTVDFAFKTSKGELTYRDLKTTLKPKEAANIARDTTAVLCTRIYAITSDGGVSVSNPSVIKIYVTK